METNKLTYKSIMTEALDVPPAHIQHTNNIASTNVMDNKKLTGAYVLAATVWGEARGEGLEGMQAVLNVIMNRANGDINKASKLAIAPKQFSFWNKINDKDEYAVQLANSSRSGKLKDSKQYNEALRLVDSAIKNNLKDITGGAKFYFNPKLAQPSWAKKMVKTATIGHHDFYKLPDKK